MLVDDLLKDLLQILLLDHEINLRQKEIFRLGAIHKAKILREDLIEHQTAQSCLNRAGYHISVRVLLGKTHVDDGMQRDVMILIGQNRLVHRGEAHALTDVSGSLLCNIVDTQNHVLRRNRHRASVRRLQEVVRGQKEEPALRLCLHGQRQVNSHLVAVEVRIEGRADQRMKLDGLTLYEDRLKGLNT